jgi:hypothetical protein
MSRREVELVEFVQDVRAVLRNESLDLEKATEDELRSFLGVDKKVSQLQLSMIGAYASELYRRKKNTTCVDQSCGSSDAGYHAFEP